MTDAMERFDLALSGGRISYEHLHRYAICRDRASGCRVLDVACGTGYGTFLLSEVATEATGLDIDAGAVATASQRYRRANLRYVEGDAYRLPFADASFDLVVANEMIEHIDDHEAFLLEAKRVLVPSGILMVSTPNKSVYNRYKDPNPFHVSELELDEFKSLLEEHFGVVELTGLRLALVSAAFELDDKRRPANSASAKTYVRLPTRGKTRPVIGNEELSLADPEYVLAVCSDASIDEPAAQASIYISQADDLWLEHEKIMAWASQLHEEDEKLRQELRAAHEELGKKNEVENATVGSRAGFEVSSRLLGKLTGREVHPDVGSTTEALFELNERLVRQAMQIERMAEFEQRAAKLSDEIGPLKLDLERLRAGLTQTLQDKASLEVSLRSQRAEFEQARLQSERAEADANARAEKLKADSASLKAALAEARSEHERAITEMKEKASDLERRNASLTIELAAVQGTVEGLQRDKMSLAAALDDERAVRTREFQERAKDVERLQGELQILTRRIADLQKPPAKQLMQEQQAPARSQDPTSARLADAVARRRLRLANLQRQARLELASAHGIGQHAPASNFTIRKAGFLGRIGRNTFDLGPLIDLGYIREQTADGRKVTIRDYVTKSEYFDIDPIPLFSAAHYLRSNPDVAEAGVSPLLHYAEHGWREGRSPHPYFTNDWYLKQNSDVLESGVNPLRHYLEHGWQEGRKPNPAFDPQAYLTRHPDVRDAGIEPLTHFVQFGRAEAREIPCQGLESDWQAALGGEQVQSVIDLMLFGPMVGGGEPSSTLAATASVWPPAALNHFWLPQRMRDFLVDSHREGAIPLYQYLYSVMAAYQETSSDFAASDSCAIILARIKETARARAREAGGAPQASVIVPVYNNLLDTLLCLAALLELDGRTSFEVIIADDGSDEVAAAVWESIGGNVRHLRQPRNLGFLGNCNAAAEVALGETVVLLNNDTLVLPDWLDHLMQPFATYERVGLVGSKLINWDGTLQEAGGIFWNDGSAWNFGRGSDPLAPEFNYLKDVDYCSGASIAVPTALWREMGGFDPAFEPAYCEDSDLAFRLRAAGYRTLYQPQSEVIHHEGRSHGRDVASGIKAYQVANQQRLFERWQDVLNAEHFPNAREVLKARDRSAGRNHVLVIDHYVPKVDQDAGSRTIYSFLQTLVESGCSVTFWPENLHHDPVYTPLLQGLGVEVIYGPAYVNKFESFMQERASLYDAVLMSRPHVSTNFIDVVEKHTSATRIYYGHDIHFERMEAQRLLHPGSLSEADVTTMRQLELSVINRSQIVLYPSDEEARKVAALAGPATKVSSIAPYCYSSSDLEQARKQVELRDGGETQVATLLFVGGFAHHPNVDALQWFINEVAPELRRLNFPFELKVVGSNAGPEIWSLAQSGVEILGFVPDDRLVDLYASCSMVIAPLRYGAGVKGKVIEAMARGAPVVTTSVGAQGIPHPERLMLLADDATNFASSIVTAHNPAVARKNADAALRFIEENYSRAAIAGVLLNAIQNRLEAEHS